jgi:dCMP deaminase
MKAKPKILILHLPVIHRGYLDIFKKLKNDIELIGLFNASLLKQISQVQPVIESLSFLESKKVLKAFGFEKVIEINNKNIKDFKKYKKYLINDAVSREVANKYFDKDIEWQSVFLRWDSDSVVSSVSAGRVKASISKNIFDKKIMAKAYALARNSSDNWRQVGAVLVKNKKEILAGYNQGMPDDHAPYQQGAIRASLKAGEKPELANYIHAEQLIISQAAKQGIKLEKTSLYVTHFPCPVCAKLIALSGVIKVYFSEGSANLDGRQILDSFKIKIIRVKK